MNSNIPPFFTQEITIILCVCYSRGRWQEVMNVHYWYYRIGSLCVTSSLGKDISFFCSLKNWIRKLTDVEWERVTGKQALLDLSPSSACWLGLWTQEYLSFHCQIQPWNACRYKKNPQLLFVCFHWLWLSVKGDDIYTPGCSELIYVEILISVIWQKYKVSV